MLIGNPGCAPVSILTPQTLPEGGCLSLTHPKAIHPQSFGTWTKINHMHDTSWPSHFLTQSSLVSVSLPFSFSFFPSPSTLLLSCDTLGKSQGGLRRQQILTPSKHQAQKQLPVCVCAFFFFLSATFLIQVVLLSLFPLFSSLFPFSLSLCHLCWGASGQMCGAVRPAPVLKSLFRHTHTSASSSLFTLIKSCDCTAALRLVHRKSTTTGVILLFSFLSYFFFLYTCIYGFTLFL